MAGVAHRDACVGLAVLFVGLEVLDHAVDVLQRVSTVGLGAADCDVHHVLSVELLTESGLLAVDEIKRLARVEQSSELILDLEEHVIDTARVLFVTLNRNQLLTGRLPLALRNEERRVLTKYCGAGTIGAIRVQDAVVGVFADTEAAGVVPAEHAGGVALISVLQNSAVVVCSVLQTQGVIGEV